MSIISWLKKNKIIEFFQHKISQEISPKNAGHVSIPIASNTTTFSAENIADYEELKKLKEEAKDAIEKTRIATYGAEKASSNAKEALKEAKDSKHLVIFGFIALVVLLFISVAGFLFGYFQIINSTLIDRDYKYGLTEKINNQNIEIKNCKEDILDLKKDNNSLLKITNCQKFKKYWEYGDCFK